MEEDPFESLGKYSGTDIESMDLHKRVDEVESEVTEKHEDIEKSKSEKWDLEEKFLTEVDKLVKKRDHEGILRLADSVLTFAPDNIHALVFKGIALVMLRRHEEAL